MLRDFQRGVLKRIDMYSRPVLKDGLKKRQVETADHNIDTLSEIRRLNK